MDLLHIIKGTINIAAFQLSISEIAINLIAAALFAQLLEQIYLRFSDSPSNRYMFSNNFMLLTLSSVLIVTVVKSSIELSLGLLAALSVIRFRSAIKDPEELSYLFLAVGIGISIGSGQIIFTGIGFSIITLILFIRYRIRKKKPADTNTLHLTISSNNYGNFDLNQVVGVLKKYCTKVTVKRFDQMENLMEAVFYVSFKDLTNLHTSKDELRQLNEKMKISFLDASGILG